MLVGSLALGPAAHADTGTITLVKNFSVVDGYTGDFGGGEFAATQFSGFVAGSLPAQGANVQIGTNAFQTFCLEGNENVTDGTLLNWTNDSAAHAGGWAASPGGPASPGSDPISPETAYLYSRFWNGTLPNYNYVPLGGTIPGVNRRTSATDLQSAIWYLEDEWTGSNVSGPGGHFGWNFLSPQAQAWVNDAFVQTASGGTWFQTWGANSIGNVAVLVLTSGTANAQDVLVLTPVTPPPPSDCCGYKDLTFKYCGSDCDSISAIDPGHCGGYYDTSLNSWCSVKCNTTFTVYAGDCWKSGKFHDSIKLVVKNKCGTIIECDTIDTDCNPPLVVGTVYGSFTLTGFRKADCKTTTSCSGSSNWGSWCWDKKSCRWTRDSSNCDDDDDNKDWCGSKSNKDCGELKGCADWSFLRDCHDFKLSDCSKSFKFCDNSSWGSWFSKSCDR